MSCPDGDYMCVVNNCSGLGSVGPGNQLFNYWSINNCPSAYAQAINTNDGKLEYSPTTQQDIQNKVVSLFNTYFLTNDITDNVTSPTYNNFQNQLLSLCIDPTLPGICTAFLTDYCSNFTRNDVLNSPTLINFCGCYVDPDPDYLQYTLATEECNLGITGCVSGCQSGDPGCTGQPACDPLCHRALTSQKANVQNGNIITCPQTICVIDDVTINATESTVPGGINFNTICSGCGGPNGGSGCLCIVSGVNISSTVSQIGVGVNFNQFCGSNSVCLVQDVSGNIISQGPCSEASLDDYPIPSFNSFPNIAILIIIFVVVVIIFLMALAIRTSS